MSRDGSDWDYINEHMGGHDEDGLPNFMREPGFSDCENETIEEQVFFENFEEAMSWAKSNPGQTITRTPDGHKFMVKPQNNRWSSEGNKRVISHIRDFWNRISYKRVGQLNLKLFENVLQQLSLSELRSLKPLLDVELKSCYETIEKCKFYKKDDRNTSLQANDIEVMVERVNSLLQQ